MLLVEVTLPTGVIEILNIEGEIHFHVKEHKALHYSSHFQAYVYLGNLVQYARVIYSVLYS